MHWLCSLVLEREVKRTFELSKSDLRMGEADGIQGLVLPFDDQPMAEATETHRLTVRARNDGGWSEWSKPFQTQVIARQQGAEQAQATLIRAIEARRVEELSKVLAEAVDIEFPEPRYVEEASSFLPCLHVRHLFPYGIWQVSQAQAPERIYVPRLLCSAIAWRRVEASSSPSLGAVLFQPSVL